MAISQLLQLIFFGGLALSLVGRNLMPEPYAKFLENNQMPVLGVCFLCNLVAGNLLNTGAFEVSGKHLFALSSYHIFRQAPILIDCISPPRTQIAFDGQLVWSKMETGRFPQMEELRSALAAVMQAAPAGSIPSP